MDELGIDPRTSRMLSERSTTELHALENICFISFRHFFCLALPPLPLPKPPPSPPKPPYPPLLAEPCIWDLNLRAKYPLG